MNFPEDEDVEEINAVGETFGIHKHKRIIYLSVNNTREQNGRINKYIQDEGLLDNRPLSVMKPNK